MALYGNDICLVFGCDGNHYAWRNRTEPSAREQAREHLDARVNDAFIVGKKRSGAPRLVLDLRDAGHCYDVKTVAAGLQRQGLRAKAGKRFKITTDSNHDLAVAENVLKQAFHADAANQKWVCDITYLWTAQGWLHLATVLDLFSRRIVGWAMSERMKSDLVYDALMMAVWNRGHAKGVIVHSDRGSQYCSKAYRGLLDAHQLVCSMSSTGNCYDNAAAESFFHTLKVELIHGEFFATREQMRNAVFESIETEYNMTRPHSALGQISPDAFEALKVA